MIQALTGHLLRFTLVQPPKEITLRDIQAKTHGQASMQALLEGFVVRVEPVGEKPVEVFDRDASWALYLAYHQLPRYIKKLIREHKENT